MNLLRAASAVTITLLLGACGADDPAPAAAPRTSPTTSPTTSSTTTSPTEPSVATETGWLRGRDATAVTIDPAVLLDGADAVAAAREDGRELDTDFYVDDDEAATVEHPLARDAVVELYDCSGGCELRAVPLDDFVAGRAQPFGGDQALVSVELRGGQAVRLTEVYLP